MNNFTAEGNHTFFQFFSTAYLKHDTTWTVILVVAYTSIFIMGLLGNLAVIVVIAKHSFMRTVTNLFILNLAVADLFVIIFCIPCTLFVNIFKPWLFTELFCKTIPYTQGVSVCASVYSLVAISLDRCTIFYRPVGKASYGLSKLQAKLVILFIWIFGLLITSPWLFSFHVVYSLREHDYEHPYCFENWDNPLYGNIYFISVPVVICFALPLLAICCLNAVIWWNVLRFEKMSSEQQLPNQYNTSAVTRMLCVISVTFLACWTPLLVLTTKLKFFGPLKFDSGDREKEKAVQEVLIAVAQLLGSFNSCVNPILYAFHSVRFRICVSSFF